MEAELRQEIEDLKARLQASEEDKDHMQAQNQELEQDVERLQSETARLQATNDTSDEEPSQLQKRLITQAEKSMQLAQMLGEAKDELDALKQNNNDLRGAMINAIKGKNTNPNEYKNVGPLKLLQLYKQCVTGDLDTARPSTGSKSTNRRPDTGSSTASTTERATLKNHVKDLRRQNSRLRKKLENASKSQSPRSSKSDAHPHLRQAMQEMPEKLRKMKLGREKAEQALEVANDKVVKLSDHIEKLVLHLKHESAGKTKALRKLAKEIESKKSKVASLQRKNVIKERVINDLKEGSAILEQQLRLMDDKYIELRTKLDWTRRQSKREVARVQKEANDLRAKWSLAGGLDLEQLLGKKAKKNPKLQALLQAASGNKPQSRLRKKKKTKLPPATKPLPHTIQNPTVSAHLPWSDNKLKSLQQDISTRR